MKNVLGNNMLNSFKPIVDEGSRILILGSMPGVESLRLQQYYANPRNQFWKLIYSIFDSEPHQAYEKRVSFIKEKRIALWDVIETCYRDGSLDSAIKGERVNDFKGLFAACPNIKGVLFNGGKAYETFKKWIGFEMFPNLRFLKLTSSSPANTRKFEEKLREWMHIKDLLD